MAALTALMTRFCMGEDSWLARRSNCTSDPGSSEARDGNGRPRRNKHKRRSNKEGTEDTVVNAGFSGSKPSQRKKPFKENRDGPSSLDRILDRPCQIHGTPDKPANHTTETIGSLNRSANSTTNTRVKGRPATTMTKSLVNRTQGDRSSFPPR